MEIKKVIKRNGNELILDWYYKDGEINPEIKTMDKITFLCERCGEEITKKRSNIKEEALCPSCQRKKTNLEKYGVEYLLQDKSRIEKAKETLRERYGDDGYNNRKKAKETNLKKYGVSNVSQIEEIKERKKQSFEEHYGEKHYFASSQFKEDMIKKFGVENQFQRDEVKEKMKQTNLERYGVEYSSQAEGWREKFIETRKKTLFNIYGSENMYDNKEFSDKMDKIVYANLKVFKEENIIPLFTYEEYKGVDISNKYKFQCKTCNTIFEDHLDDGRIPRCPTCFPSNRSKGEIELADFLKQYIDIIENDRELIKPYEIDILIPSKKLAIEYNGTYWHTEKFGRDDEYHQMKLDKMNEKGYNLIMIWEDIWNENKEEVKEMLLNRISA